MLAANPRKLDLARFVERRLFLPVPLAEHLDLGGMGGIQAADLGLHLGFTRGLLGVAVLAQAGAPVCAERLTMPPVSLATSMRIRDSLEDGVSFYMAELLRLKEIVEAARDGDSRNHRPLLYLLDEILLGTNSRERHLAVVRVLRHLLKCGAIGAISTHDLELGTNEPLAGVCRCVHFCETLHDRDAERPMTFDYKVRPGIATTSNALKLLEIVGLGAEET